MAWGMDDCIVGGQLRVGTGLVPAIKEGDEKINGSMHAEGPVVFGSPGAFSDNVSTLMIARTTNDDKDCTPANRSLWVKGNTRIEGDSDTANALLVTGGSEHSARFTGSGTNTVYIDGDLYVSGSTDTGNKGRLASRFAAADASPKPFDMQHPTKGEGNRLRYACIEGPEVGVYFRGRLRRGKEIFLPNYWKGLVHIQSITVQLQPIGAHQDIIIKRWDDEKIYLQSNGGLPIDCFYHVYAERKDCNPLVVEYQGDGWEDYPDKDYKDPNFSGPPNIITL